MAVALELKNVNRQEGGGRVVREYSVTFSGSYANSGTTGDLLDFQGADNPGFIPSGKWARVPEGGEVLNQPAGWVMRLEPGDDFDNWGIRVFQSDDAVDPLDEHADGAYAASLTGSDGDALRIRLFGKNV